MRIKLKCEPTPKIGDTKTEKEFLLFPTTINCNLVWLETVNVVYEYKRLRYEDYTGYKFYQDEWYEIRKDYTHVKKKYNRWSSYRKRKG